MKTINVKGLENYAISEEGRIYSYLTHRYLKTKQDKDGYLSIGLVNTEVGKQCFYQVHRLVALTYIPNPENLPLVNHKDENKGNPCASNLEWCDASYNQTYGSAKYSHSRPVIATKDGEEHRFECYSDCAEFIGVKVGTVKNTLYGK